MIINAVEQAFRRAKEKNWWKIYVAVDIHGVVLVPTYETDGEKIFYPHAEESMQYLTKRKDIILMMYTCSHPETIAEYYDFFLDRGIEFDYLNTNPEVENDHLGYYKFKPYMNIFIDDKAGFMPSEWPILIDEIKKYDELKSKE